MMEAGRKAGSKQTEKYRQEGSGSPPVVAKDPGTNPTAPAQLAAALWRGKTGSWSFD